MDRRKFIKGSALAAGGLALYSGQSDACLRECPAEPAHFNLTMKDPTLADLTGGKRPNILFIMTDQERWPGNLPPTLNRPHFDRMRENSVSFDNTFCVYPLCSPSRAAMMNGMYCHQSGVMQNMMWPVAKKPLSRKDPHLGSVLSSAGYRIGYKGKWDLSRGPTYYAMNLKDRGRAGKYGFEGHCGDVPDQEYGYAADDQVVDMSCDWIGQQSKDQPWFLVSSIINPHDICHPQLKPDDSIRPDVELPASWRDDLSDKPADQQALRESMLAHFNQFKHPDSKPFFKYEERDWKLFLSFYYDLIETTDRYIGKLMKALEDNGMAENTIIVYTSDHGELGGAHGFSGKYMGYEEDLHVPLYVYHPSLKQGSVDAMVENTSIAPTIAGLAGAEWPSDIPGQDLGPWLNGGDGPSRDEVFSETETRVHAGVYRYRKATRMIRTGQYKLSWSFYKAKDGQLYDLAADPIEMNNLFHDPAHKGLRDELMGRLRAWQKETGDHLMVPNI